MEGQPGPVAAEAVVCVMNRGYIKLFRCVQDNPLWQEKPFDRARAWVDLILLANYREGQVRRRGIRVHVHTGEIGYSLREIAERWGWSLGKVQRFMDELKTDTQIDTRNDTENVNVTSVIRLINYERYQEGDTENDTENGSETDRRRVQNKKVKKEKKLEPNTPSSSADEAEAFFPTKRKRKLSGKRLASFNQFWEAFGYKSGKAEAADAWLDIPELTDAIVATITRAARGEAEGRAALRAAGKTPKMAQGWISGRRWEDEAPSPDQDTTPQANPEDMEKLRKVMAKYAD